MLNEEKRKRIVAYDSCSTACDTGCRKRLDEIAMRLKEDVYDAVFTDLFPMPCTAINKSLLSLYY